MLFYVTYRIYTHNSITLNGAIYTKKKKTFSFIIQEKNYLS